MSESLHAYVAMEIPGDLAARRRPKGPRRGRFPVPPQRGQSHFR